GPTVRINGGVNNSQTMLVEGMDASNSLGQGASQQNQVGVDSVQEFAIQTSNYAAEFGQAGSAIMNITMRSGTNGFHGSAYEYFVHEKLNAGQPLLNVNNTKAGNLVDGNPRFKRGATTTASPSGVRRGFRKSTTDGAGHFSSSIGNSIEPERM